ncbi:MAG: PEP-utilizing enzyme [Patescibacteria group bacterium]
MPKKNKKIEWTLYFRRPTMSILFYSSLASHYSENFFNKRGIKGIGLNRTKFYSNGEVYFNEHEWNGCGEFFYKLILNKPKLFKKTFCKYTSEGNKFIKFAKKANKDNNLLFVWNEFEKMSSVWAFWIVLAQTADSFLENHIREIIRKNSFARKNENKILSILTKPNKKTLSEQEIINLYKIVEKKETIQKHLKKYGWLGARDWIGNPPDKKELETRIKIILPNIKKLNKAQIENSLISKKEFDFYINKLNISKKDKDIINFTKEIVYLRTYRTDIFHRVGFIMRDIFLKTAKKFDLTYEDFLKLTLNEILYYLKSNDLSKLKKEIKNRKNKNWIYTSVNGRDKVVYQEKKDLEELNLNEFKGSVAYNGNCYGLVKVILDKSQFYKINKGDIIVTAMTSPNFLPVLKFVKGIITDEGGITCHAAIIARELRIPCIIGTKIATKILKDGDRVEMDANNGIIKIIK